MSSFRSTPTLFDRLSLVSNLFLTPAGQKGPDESHSVSEPGANMPWRTELEDSLRPRVAAPCRGAGARVRALDWHHSWLQSR